MNLFRRIQPGEAAVIAMALLPGIAALPWLLSPWPGDAAAWLQATGRLAGILGLVALLLAGILAIRVPGFDQPFGGLTRLWRLHHVLGSAALLLLMLHPLLLAFAAMPGGITAAAETLLPAPAMWAAWAGWAALLAMMVFLAPTYSFFGAPEYQRWKRLHLLAGAALLLAIIHGVALGRAYPGAWNTIAWSGAGLLALAAYAWRALLSKRIGRKHYRIVAVEPLADRVVEIALEPVGSPLQYRAGQFVYFTPRDPALSAGCNEEHPYTLSSAPGSEELRIAIKDFGDASHALQTVTPGTEADIDGPYGSLFPGATNAPELWLGGGIGLTPFISRARSFATGQVVNVQLVYCAEDLSRAYFLDELRDIASRVEGFHVLPHLAAEQGFLSAESLQERVPDFARRDAFICGPLPMIRLCRKILRRAGVPAHRIRSEEFTLL